MRTQNGTVQVQMYDAVRLTIQERDCVMEVQEIQGNFANSRRPASTSGA
jgi:hypothetical protein